MCSCLKNIPAFLFSALLLLALGGCTFRPTTGDYDFALSPSVGQRQDKSFQSWEPILVLPASASSLKNDISRTSGPYVLDTGDRIRVLIYKEPELSHSYLVDPEGYISLPLVGFLKARGKTPREIGETLHSRLIAEGYFKDPKVAVEVEKNRPFYIYGAVRNAGQYPFVSNMSAETAVAIAGGLTDRGRDRIVRVTRRTKDFVEKKDVPPEYLLMPGDIVFVYSGLF